MDIGIGISSVGVAIGFDVVFIIVVVVVVVTKAQVNETRVEIVHFLVGDGTGVEGGRSAVTGVTPALFLACARRYLDRCIDQPGEVLNTAPVGILILASPTAFAVFVTVVGFLVLVLVLVRDVLVGISPHEIALVEAPKRRRYIGRPETDGR
jgi:hypothetical protein